MAVRQYKWDITGSFDQGDYGRIGVSGIGRALMLARFDLCGRCFMNIGRGLVGLWPEIGQCLSCDCVIDKFRYIRRMVADTLQTLCDK